MQIEVKINIRNKVLNYPKRFRFNMIIQKFVFTESRTEIKTAAENLKTASHPYFLP